MPVVEQSVQDPEHLRCIAGGQATDQSRDRLGPDRAEHLQDIRVRDFLSAKGEHSFEHRE